MNRGSDSILSVYSDARAEYTKQLCVFLVPAYFQFFIDLLEKAKYDMINEPKKSLWQFQTYLNEIHDWNMEKVNNEIHRIYVNCGCDYLDDLLTAVFIAHTKVLTAIRLSANKKKIEINVPKVEHFLFKVLCETSKLLWSSTYLFRDGIPGIEKQQNYRSIEQIINEGILQAVRSLVPVKSILRDFVNNDIGDEAEEESDEEKEKEVTQEITIPNPISISDSTKLETIQDTSSTQNELIQTDIPTELENISEATVPVNEMVEVQNEIVEKPVEVIQQANPPTIIIDEKPRVRFGEFDAVFDTENPNHSDMIYDPKDDEEEDVPALEILDEQGTSLSEGFDFETLENTQNEVEDMGVGDYEELH